MDGITSKISELGETLGGASVKLLELRKAIDLQASMTPEGSSFVTVLTIFVLAIFVGYYVVWRVTPALHSPLMAVTNALSSVIIVGALLACGAYMDDPLSRALGFLATICAAVNIVGGFFITYRMLEMFEKSSSRGKTQKSDTVQGGA